MSGLPNGWAMVTLGDVTSDCAQKIPPDDEAFAAQREAAPPATHATSP